MSHWPAFNNQIFPYQFNYERAIWGKVHNASSDFRWIAATARFISNNNDIERQYFGAEDKPNTFFAWKQTEDLYYAMHAYPSQSMDQSGRTGFTEKQFIQWQPNHQISKQMAMFALVYQVSQYNDDDWINHKTSAWDNDSFYLALPDAAATLTITKTAIEHLITQGIDELNQVLDQQILGEFYAALLTAQYPAMLKLSEPLSAIAFACLFLPVPNTIFSELSIASWLPTARYSAKKLKNTWDVIITDQPLTYHPTLSTDNLRYGENLAQSLLNNNPAMLEENQAIIEPDSSTKNNANITLWGPSASGKTFLLAQLYLQATTAYHHWEVHPTKNTAHYIDPFRQNIVTDNVFPIGTGIGDNNELNFRFFNTQNKQQVDLNVEDRAGTDYSQHHKEVMQRLMTTDGLVILINFADKREEQIEEVLKMLDDMIIQRGEHLKDTRPLAICYTQVDKYWVDTPESWQAAIDMPDDFIKSQLHANDKIIQRVQLHFNHYKLFPVSAAGLRLQYGTILQTAFFNEDFKACICPQGEAINLLAPFLWIIEQFNIPSKIDNQYDNNDYE